MWIKILIPVIMLASGTIGGIFAGAKMAKAPVCNCPEVVIPKCPPNIEVQSLDLERIRKIKGNFTFSPVYNGDVYMVNGDDTTKIK